MRCFGAVRAGYVAVVLSFAGLLGCSTARLGTVDRYARGLVVILPGIEGRSLYSEGIARGLEQGGVPAGIEIYDWGSPLSPLSNIADLERNRRQAQKLAERIANYRRDFPGRPIFLFGHSAGAGLTILTLEALPARCPVKAVYLLGAAVGPEHDLRGALAQTEEGIWNFYSGYDVGWLGVGTSLFGTVDRRHGPAAGAVGFKQPDGLGAEDERLYGQKLHQVKYFGRMARSGHSGSHTGWASSRFVRDWLAPLVLRSMGYPAPEPAGVYETALYGRRNTGLPVP